MIFYSLALLTVFASPLWAADSIGKIQSMLSRPKVLCGRFEQSKKLTGVNKPLRSSGRFCVVTDKGVLWRSLQPFPNTVRLTRDEIVQWQGERVATRLDAKHEPMVRMINTVLFALLAGDLGQLQALFEIDGSVHGDSWTATLKARQAGLAKVIGTIALDGGRYVEKVTIKEASGDRTAIVFSNIQAGEAAMTVDEAALFE